MTDSAPSKIVIRSDPSQIRMVQDQVIPLLERANYCREFIFAVRLAMDEAIANAMRHGNGGDANKNVTIHYEITNDYVKISVCDEGHGFTPERVPDCTAAENLAQPHGRGVMLMNAYMSNVCYNEEGNCVTMVKHRNCTKPHKDD